MSGDHTKRFDRLPQTDNGDGGLSRSAVLSWWDRQYGIPPTTFEPYTFWERGRGKIWAFAGSVNDPCPFDGLGMHVLRAGDGPWKPTTTAAQRFGKAATKNVLELPPPAARRFVAGETQVVTWSGEWGYVLVATSVGGRRTILGVGHHHSGELKSQIPKGRQRALSWFPEQRF